MCMRVKNLCAYLLSRIFSLLHILGVDPCYVSGQVVIIGLLTVQIHSELCLISWNWSIIANGNLYVSR